ncbi:MAG: hypothetical protein AB8H86_24750, partial [Polyangiales bacterium]
VDPTLSHCGDAGLLDAVTVDANDAGPDVPASNCPTACEGDRPICDEDGTEECVQCLTPTDCEGMGVNAMCNDAGTCVQCVDSTQCTEPGASECATEGIMAGSCVGCTVGAEGACAGVEDGDGNALNVCDDSAGSGVCIQCTEATAEVDCGMNSCNPATNLCTETARGDVGRCEACVSDAECMDGDGCLEIDEPGGAAAYCLPILPEEGICPNVYGRVLTEQTTLSSAGPISFCSIPSALTCAAVRAAADPCEAEEPRCPSGGTCTDIPGRGERCTFACTAPEDCPAGFLSSCDAETFCGL